MKKLATILIGLLLLSGCRSLEKSTFSLKEKCREYKNTAQERIDEENLNLLDYQNERLLIGTYYSATEETCVSEVFYPADTITPGVDTMYQVWDSYLYLDELTGVNLYVYSESPPGHVLYYDEMTGADTSVEKSKEDLESLLGLLK